MKQPDDTSSCPLTPEQLSFRVEGKALFALADVWSERAVLLRTEEALMRETAPYTAKAVGLTASAIEDIVKEVKGLLADSIPADIMGSN